MSYLIISTPPSFSASSTFHTADISPPSRVTCRGPSQLLFIDTPSQKHPIQSRCPEGPVKPAPALILVPVYLLSSSALPSPTPLPNQSSAAAPEAPKTEDPPAKVESPKSAGPVDGLRRFSRDGADGVFMGAAGVPVRYRL